MRIGVYLDDFSPDTGGGFTFQDDIFRALVELQDPRQHSFVVYSKLSSEQVRGFSRPHLRFQPGHSRGWRRLRGWLGVQFEPVEALCQALHIRSSFERSLRKQAVELLWFVTPNYYRVDTPYIYTVWDLQHRVQPWFPEVSSGGRWQVREKGLSQAVSRAVAVITANAVGREEVIRFYQVPEERVKTLPLPTPGFALQAPASDGRAVLERYRLPGNFLFYPAQFWPHKNHVNLLAAVALLKERDGLALPLVFAGADHGNLKHVQAVADRWGLAGQTHFLGFVPREDLVSLYRNALALTFVTYFGPTNLPPLEAFALGCPVIASRVPGAVEQLADAALLVEPSDPESIAAAIKSVYQDSALRQRLIESGRQRARGWTAREYVSTLLNFFDEFATVRRCWPADL